MSDYIPDFYVDGITYCFTKLIVCVANISGQETLEAYFIKEVKPNFIYTLYLHHQMVVNN